MILPSSVFVPAHRNATFHAACRPSVTKPFPSCWTALRAPRAGFAAVGAGGAGGAGGEMSAPGAIAISAPGNAACTCSTGDGAGGAAMTGGAAAGDAAGDAVSPALSRMSLNTNSATASYSVRPSMPLPWHNSPATFADVWAMIALSRLLILYCSFPFGLPVRRPNADTQVLSTTCRPVRAPVV